MRSSDMHNAVISEINAFLSHGKKRISILMPTGCGTSTLMGKLVTTSLSSPIVLVSQKTVYNSLIARKDELFSNNSPNVLTVAAIRNNPQIIQAQIRTNNNVSFVLFDITPVDRVLLSELIPSNSTVISFGHGPVPRIPRDSVDKSAPRLFECFVFYSETLLDVRDLITASATERQAIINQISHKEKLLNTTIHAIRTAPYNASPEASQEELDYLQKKIRERDRIIAEKEETISILTSLLKSAGISNDEILASISHIKEIKHKYSRIKNDETAEIIANTVAEESKKLFSQHLTPFTREYFTSLIESSITKEVWKKMQQESQTCLITGKIAFQSMINADDDSLDYSGICILAAKALDIEMSLRFYTKYLEYLQDPNNHFNLSQWPNTLFDKYGNVLTDDGFTLGSIKYVIGISEDGAIKNRYVYKMFLQYAKSALYDPSFSEVEITEHLKKCVNSIETVRLKYRNPAAHRTSLDRVTAEECFNYLVDTYKKLKEILEVLN